LLPYLLLALAHHVTVVVQLAFSPKFIPGGWFENFYGSIFRRT